MVKKLIILFLGLIILIILYLNNRFQKNVLFPNISPTPAALGVSEDVDELLEVEYKGGKYAFDYFVVEETDNLSLIPNFESKETAKSIMAKNNCEKLVSGGFYGQDHQPIGLFVTNGTEIKASVVSSLLNSFLTINDFGTPRITREMPEDHLLIALQTGPLLIENSFPLKNSINNDHPARRIVGAVTGGNKLVFLIVYDSLSVFSGPHLGDLANIIDKINVEFDLGIVDAVNLDGGKASAFLKEGTRLTELSFLGSAFCVKK